MEESVACKPASYLGRRREQLGLSPKEVAHAAGLNTTYIYRLESGERGKRPPRATLRKLAHAYQVTEQDIEAAIAGGAPSLPPIPPLLSPADQIAQGLARLPLPISVVDHPAHAGHSGSPVIDYVYVERSLAQNRDLVCVPVEGDCMQPLIEPGDRVIVDRAAEPEQGQVVIAVIDERVYVRRFYLTNSYIVLRADNPDYSDIETTEADIVGVVLEIRKRTYRRP